MLDENLAKSKAIEDARIEAAIQKAMERRSAEGGGDAPAEGGDAG